MFTASRLQSTCTATESGLSGSTTVTGGTLRTSQGDPNVEGDDVVVNIPTNPAPNTTINGQIETVGDSFQYIFNEQVVNPDGSLTVYAAHQRLLGPAAAGDLYIGRVDCGVTANGGPTTTSSTTSTSTSTTTTTIPVPTTCDAMTATITGTNAAETLIGTPGDDVIVGGAGDDTI